MANQNTQWRKFRVIGVVEQGRVVPNVRHLNQSDTRWYALLALDIDPAIQIKVPAYLIDQNARFEGSIVEAAYIDGQLRGRYVLPIAN
ncbi:MAG: hypothetical protein OIF51_15890 [Cellvibrionaceae bacterium]|nr:hypothetical protein [Cellvibrionaceae bacterium]